MPSIIRNVIVRSSIENFLHSFWSHDCLWIKPVYFQKINNNKNNYDLVKTIIFSDLF